MVLTLQTRGCRQLLPAPHHDPQVQLGIAASLRGLDPELLCLTAVRSGVRKCPGPAGEWNKSGDKPGLVHGVNDNRVVRSVERLEGTGSNSRTSIPLSLEVLDCVNDDCEEKT